MHPRGELVVEFGSGVSFTMRPTFEVYAAIESRVGPLSEAMAKLEAFSVVALATVVWAGITQGGAQKVAGFETVPQVGEKLLALEGGLVELTVRCMVFLGQPIRTLSKVGEGKGDTDTSKSEGPLS